MKTLVSMHQLITVIVRMHISILFFFNDTATTDIYTLSLHDALPICMVVYRIANPAGAPPPPAAMDTQPADRKSTRLNSSHVSISYAVFCLKKKKKSLT